VTKRLSPATLIVLSVILVGLLALIFFVFRPVVLPEIIIPAEVVFHLWGMPITNTLLATWLTMIVLVALGWSATRNMKIVPGRWQGFVEMVVEGFYGMVEGIAGEKWARRWFPIVMTIFLLVVVSNWLGLTPLFTGWGVLHPSEHGKPVEWLNESQTVGLWLREDEAATAEDAHAAELYVPSTAHEEGEVELYTLAPMFRSAATDLNLTLALALISQVLAQVYGVWALGAGYFGKFVPIDSLTKPFTTPGLGCAGRIGALGMALIDVFVGFLESISEIAKVISFSFRLFGNIFAGEVLLGVLAFLIPYLVSLPFYGLEIFVGFVQALVFMMLTVAFWIIAVSGHGEEGH
jgi:F-type H+-transporting ATPase subunit a